ncbi:MAG TPA: TonB C-terminal domain-containing protein [Nitrospirota bacterium]|nr:TonB C-terminal domain-containing protein [Nitrospirota bacterium]
MRLLSGKRIGQSRPELAYAVLFSFFLHVIILFTAIFLNISVTPKRYVPPVYQVRLVGQPVDIPQVPSGGPAGGASPPVPKHEIKPAPKKSAVPQRVAKAAPAKGAMPELAQPKQRPRKEEEAKPEEIVKEQPSNPIGGPSVSGGGSESGVTVATAQPDFKFQYYINAVREKIGQQWRPPPDVKDAKARVTFTVNRSGWVGEVNLDAEHSTGTFGFKQAAVRAIRSSNPFPPLPEDFAKQSLEFSVDLMEKE